MRRSRRAGAAPALALIENPDILATVARRAAGRPGLVVGFAAETENVVENARAKLARKGCDLIVANDVSPDLGVMGGDDNTVHLVTADGVETWPTLDKDEVARRLIARLADMAGGDAPVSVTVRVQRLAHGEDLPLPRYETAGAAGLDLLAAVADDAPLVLRHAARALVPTGLVIQLPDGFEAQVRPRSGLASSHGVTVLNAPGTIDADYRGEVQVLLVNLGSEPFTVARGMRIAQLVVAPVTRVALVEARRSTRAGAPTAASARPDC